MRFLKTLDRGEQPAPRNFRELRVPGLARGECGERRDAGGLVGVGPGEFADFAPEPGEQRQQFPATLLFERGVVTEPGFDFFNGVGDV
jgi:hypothetical protein